MRKIYKYPFEIIDIQTVKLPKGAIILTAQLQNGRPCIWAYVDPSEIEAEDVTLRVYGTGQEIDDSLDLTYVSTIQIREKIIGQPYDNRIFVWHVFKVD